MSCAMGSVPDNAGMPLRPFLKRERSITKQGQLRPRFVYLLFPIASFAFLVTSCR